MVTDLISGICSRLLSFFRLFGLVSPSVYAMLCLYIKINIDICFLFQNMGNMERFGLVRIRTELLGQRALFYLGHVWMFSLE